MNIKPFCADDVASFLTLAVQEGWIVEPWEPEFLLSRSTAGCSVAQNDEGETVGFITSLRHDRSAWIGNLIVAPEYRGAGIGRALFKSALDKLQDGDVETVWLTASKDGMPLYKKFGFTRIDTIVRWSGSGRQQHGRYEGKIPCSAATSDVFDMDHQAWGDRREELVSVTAKRGALMRQKSAFIVVQPGQDVWQFGPFTAPGYSSADSLLKVALRGVPAGIRMCVDAPVSNRAAVQLFTRSKMHISGTTELMYAGAVPAYRPEFIYGLATMGSCG